MAKAPVEEQLPGPALEDFPATPGPTDCRPAKRVPETRDLRDRLRSRCDAAAGKFDQSQPLAELEMANTARGVLHSLDLPDDYLGWTMVMLASSFWRDQVAAVPHDRRLFLLPARQGSNGHGMPGSSINGHPVDAPRNGGPRPVADIDDLRNLARNLGYQVATLDRPEALVQTIMNGSVDAVVGVAGLDLLEKAIDKILLAGIPCMAVPLLNDEGRGLAIDRDWVIDMLRLEHRSPAVQASSYVHLLRGANAMFETAELERLAPRLHSGTNLGVGQPSRLSRDKRDAYPTLHPIAGTETIAYDFLARGGKHSRPFITLAVYNALTNPTNGRSVQTNGAAPLAGFPDAVKRAALSIETFHKASLVHDDIEDDDQYRYGVETLHRRYGTATAINVGDYLIGLGYRLVSREARTLGPDVAADILDSLADAHMRLCEGQGAELLWRDSRNKRLLPADALHIYALKTAPAFEAALYTGLRLAGPADDYREPIGEFARHLGVAFQILNDLGDWQGDANNKLLAGGDVLGGRPTVLWALALEGLASEDRAELESLASQTPPTSDIVEQVRRLYEQADVFAKAAELVDQHQRSALAIAGNLRPESLRRLLYYLVEIVLRPVGNALRGVP